MQDSNPLLVGEQADEGKSTAEIERERESEEQERAEFIEAWKTMYRRKGLDPETYHIDWDAVFEDERGE
ncbi:MAG TPA: hypothetical protein VH591_17455 [Ktedonobacterales bacterium]|jgi:hypothetical protein